MGDMPQVVWLQIPLDCKLAQLGYPSDGAAIEHSKLDIFSEAHYWCQEFYDDMLKEAVTMEQDHDGTLYPEIYAAWKTAGGADGLPMVATCPKYGKWAVGFGGKKNAERACKLALATAIAKDADPSKTQAVIRNYPGFGKYLQSVGLME